MPRPNYPRRKTTSLATKLGGRYVICECGKYLYPRIEPQNLHRPDHSLVAIPPKLGRNLFRHSQHYLDLGVVTSIYFAFLLISRSAAADSLLSSYTFSAAYGLAYAQRGYGTTRATGTSLTSRDAVKQTESEAQCRQWSYINVANRRRR
jgi:hypothetical protein